jgi:hypothetical protein
MQGRPFTLEDARKLAIARSFAVIIEKKVSELAMSEADFTLVTGHLRTLLAALDGMREVHFQHHPNSDCSNGYEFCEDGICRVWCS